jgi:hypothetical protein
MAVGQTPASPVDLSGVPGLDNQAPPPRRAAAFGRGFRGRILGHRIEYA